MAKGVESGQAFNTSLVTDLDELLPEFHSQLAAVFRTENVFASVRCTIMLLEILKKFTKCIVDGHFSFAGLGLPGFLAAYADLPFLEVNIRPLKVLQLSPTHPSIQKSVVDRIQLGWTSLEQPLAFFNCEESGRFGIIDLQLGNVLRGVLLKIAPFDCQVEHKLERPDFKVDGVRPNFFLPIVLCVFILGLDSLAVIMYPALLAEDLVPIDEVSSDLRHECDTRMGIEEGFEVIQDDVVPGRSRWLVADPRVLKKPTEELVNGNVVVGESEFVSCCLHFRVLQRELREFLGRADFPSDTPSLDPDVDIPVFPRL